MNVLQRYIDKANGKQIFNFKNGKQIIVHFNSNGDLLRVEDDIYYDTIKAIKHKKEIDWYRFKLYAILTIWIMALVIIIMTKILGRTQ